MPNRIERCAVAVVLSFASIACLAQLRVEAPWVRATVPEQRVTGAFMTLTAGEPLRLVEARSPLAGNVEVHEMAMQGGVMKMRAIAALDLPAGKTVELKPGGFHVMLFELKRQILAGETVPLTLVVVDAAGKRREVQVSAQVRALGAN
jgi:copper(I)-binding protein